MKKRIFGRNRLLAVCGAATVFAFTASAQTSTTTITRAPGSYSQNTTVAGANGKTATYQRNANWGNGSYSGSASYTGPNGKTVTSNTTAARTPGATTRETSITGPNGKTATYQDNRSWGNGAYTNTRTTTGFNGATRSDTRTRSGGIVTNSYKGWNGKTHTFSRFARRR